MKFITAITSNCVALLVLVSACTQDGGKPNTTTTKAEAVTTKLDHAIASTTVTLSEAATKTKPKFPRITVYKSPTCGCCSGWVSYLKSEGLAVTAIDTDDVDRVKAENGLSDRKLMSCHTALVDGYVIEGHVPVVDIKKLLREKPNNIKGLTAPGMPMYSPGMASLIPKDYDVLSFTESGETAVYSSY
ncbi:MAG: DUF411 domain-containing protein [Granulosicoccaceae bacterium]